MHAHVKSKILKSLLNENESKNEAHTVVIWRKFKFRQMQFQVQVKYQNRYNLKMIVMQLYKYMYVAGKCKRKTRELRNGKV